MNIENKILTQMVSTINIQKQSMVSEILGFHCNEEFLKQGDLRLVECKNTFETSFEVHIFLKKEYRGSFTYGYEITDSPFNPNLIDCRFSNRIWIKRSHPTTIPTFPEQPEFTHLKYETTNRGLDHYVFNDKLDLTCTIQKSSVATEDCIWLGQGDHRMHLTQPIVKELLVLLNRFVETGDL